MRFITAALLTLLTAPARAENGSSGAAFLLRPLGARAAAMGQAAVSLPAKTADGLLFNPASTIYISSRTASADYLRGYADDSTGFAAFAAPLGGIVLTPAIFYYNAGTMNLNLSNGTRGTVTAEEDTMLIAAASAKPLKFLAVGAAFKYWSSSLAQSATARGTSWDIGAMAELPYGFMAGAALQNAGGSIKYEDVSDPAPLTQRLGFCWRGKINGHKIDSTSDFSDIDFTAATDYSKTLGEDGYFQSGVEIGMKPGDEMYFALRAGYMFGREVQTATFGAGVEQSGWGLDYGYGGARELPALHQFTLSRKF
ncbi:MAG: PorV/PorQ family protein [Elusimicrobiales bacterium]